MEFILTLGYQTVEQVWLTLVHNWPFLAISVLVAALLKLYLQADKVSAFMSRYRSAGVVAATAAAVTTPLCSCGTTAVILGMLASTIPWAPIIAFMVASPLTSPQELVYSAGLFGWPFATAFFLASILLGLAGGWIGGVLDNRGWLKNQRRLAAPDRASCACSLTATHNPQPVAIQTYRLDVSNLMVVSAQPSGGCAPLTGQICGSELAAPVGCGETYPGQKGKTDRGKVTLSSFAREIYASGTRLLAMFLGFAFIGYFLNGLIPESWVGALFGRGSAYSVPLAATLGLPFYINTEASLPLVRAFMDAGMSQGAALAFLISGAGTSIGAVAGAMTIARWRVIGLVVVILWLGAIASGLGYDLLLSTGLF